VSITNLAKYLVEMGAAKQCPNCGHPMAGYHYYYKGEWKCKSTSINNPAPGFTPTGVSPATAGGTTPTPVAPTTAKPTPTPATVSPPLPAKQSTGPVAKTAPPSTVSPAPQKSTPLTHDVTLGNGDIKAKITKWLTHVGVENFTINPDLTVDVDGDVYFGTHRWTEFPVKFGVIKGNFICAVGHLESCVNFPDEVEGECDITGQQLKSLKGFPSKVGTGVHGGGVDISFTPLTSMDGISEEINGDLVMTDTRISSLEGIADKITKLNGIVDVTHSPVTHNILGVLEIPGVTGFKSGGPADEIMNGFFDKDNPKDPFEIQNELFDAGLADMADL